MTPSENITLGAERDDQHCLVCGREIAPAERLREVYEGKHCHFCSPECQARLEQDPERYLGETQDLLRPLGYC